MLVFRLLFPEVVFVFVSKVWKGLGSLQYGPMKCSRRRLQPRSSAFSLEKTVQPSKLTRKLAFRSENLADESRIVWT